MTGETGAEWRLGAIEANMAEVAGYAMANDSFGWECTTRVICDSWFSPPCGN